MREWSLIIALNLSDGVTDFFFQAEDGIRDQPRSRGLGDVYKRQLPDNDIYRNTLYDKTLRDDQTGEFYDCDYIGGCRKR